MRSINIPPGTSIEDACELAHKIVNDSRECDPVSFEFNGVTTEVHEGMTVDDIMEKAFQGKLKLERYQKAKFEHDLRHAIRTTLGHTMANGDETDVEILVTAIRPFLRTP